MVLQNLRRLPLQGLGRQMARNNQKYDRLPDRSALRKKNDYYENIHVQFLGHLQRDLYKVKKGRIVPKIAVF